MAIEAKRSVLLSMVGTPDQVGPLSRVRAARINIKAAMRLSKIAKLIDDDLTAFTEARNAKIKEYGVQRPDGNWEIKADSEHWSKFQEEMQAAMDEVVTIGYDPVPASWFGDKAEVTTDDMIGIAFLWAEDK